MVVRIETIYVERPPDRAPRYLLSVIVGLLAGILGVVLPIAAMFAAMLW